MRSKVKFIFDKKNKHAMIKPASEFLQKKLKQATGKDEAIVGAKDGNLSLEVLEKLLFIEIIGMHTSDEKIFTVKEELKEIKELKLIKSILNELENSGDIDDQKLYKQLRKKIDSKKLGEIISWSNTL